MDAIFDLNGNPYVFVLRTQDGLFGKELYVQRVYIVIREVGEKLAALQDNTLGSEVRVVVSSSEQLFSGDTVWSITGGVSEIAADNP